MVTPVLKKIWLLVSRPKVLVQRDETDFPRHALDHAEVDIDRVVQRMRTPGGEGQRLPGNPFRKPYCLENSASRIAKSMESKQAMLPHVAKYYLIEVNFLPLD